MTDNIPEIAEEIDRAIKALPVSVYRATEAHQRRSVNLTIDLVEAEEPEYMRERTRSYRAALYKAARESRRGGRAGAVVRFRMRIDRDFMVALERGGSYEQEVRKFTRSRRSGRQEVRSHARTRREAAKRYVERGWSDALRHLHVPFERAVAIAWAKGRRARSRELTAGLSGARARRG